MKQQQDVEAEFMAKVDFLLKQENQIVDKIFKFTVSNAINEPAFQFAAENFNSLSQQILQKLSEAIDAENNEEATDERKVLHHSLHQVRYAWANVMNGLRGFLAFKADNNKDEVINYLEAFQTEMGRVNKKSDIFTLEQEDSILFINEARNNLKEKFDKMTEIHTGKKGRMDAFFIRDQLGPVTKQLKIVIDDFITARKNKTTSSSTSVLSEVDNTMMLSIGLLVFSILLGVGIYLFSIVTIARPIDEIVLAMEDIAQGEGDLKKRMDVKGRDELAKLSTAFNAFISRIHSMFTDVRGVSLEMSKASSTLNSVTNENRNGIEQQHQETDLVATAANELSATASEVSGRAINAAEYAAKSNQRATDGAKVVENTLSDIQKMANMLADSSEKVQKLNEDSARVSEIIKVIEGIAEQTNLLALNAAIEAARAGDQGRGFAVVADEVRSLATRTQSSATEIHTMIESLQENTSSTVIGINSSNELANNTANSASQAQDALRAIISDLGEINNMNSEIASSSSQQVNVAEEISQNITRINQVSENSLAGIEELTRISQQLIDISGDVDQELNQFKL